MINKKTVGIILAGGIGSRTGLGFAKQFLQIENEYIINILIKNIIDEFDELIVVVDPNHKDKIIHNSKIVIAKNSDTRLGSLQNGLKQAQKIIKEEAIIFIHDAARALLNKEDIINHKKNAKLGHGLITTKNCFDTMFRIENEKIIEIINKNEIVHGYNPQSFWWSDLKKYWNEIIEAKNDLDLAQILIGVDFPIKTLSQISDLRKITTKDDVEWIKIELRKN